MININDLFNAVQIATALAIIAFVIFYFAYKKEIHER